MSIKINYLIPSDKDQALIGRIVFLKNFKQTGVDFPYFYMGEKNQILNKPNWPDLVPYLYDKKIIIFNNNNAIDYFSIYNCYTEINDTSVFSLEFRDEKSIIALNGLIEDKKMSLLENNNEWYRTITPSNDIMINNKIILKEKENYKIDDIIMLSPTIIKVNIKINNSDAIRPTLLNNKNIEFGLYRIEGTKNSIIYNAVTGKYFSTSNSKDFIGGLKTRSQLIEHAHRHIHDITHTHTMSHMHDMSNHTHNMQHTHSYSDMTSGPGYINNGSVMIGTYGNILYTGWNANLPSGPLSVTTKATNLTNKTLTDPPIPNITGLPNFNTTSSPDNNVTSEILSKTTELDNKYTNINNFKIGDKNYYNSDVIYVYIFGGSYNP
jgi:hypothetical protein